MTLDATIGAPMIALSDRTIEHIRALFADADVAEAARLLGERCAEAFNTIGEPPTPTSLERIRFVALRLSAGDLQKLREAIDLACLDWRDLLVAADFGDPRAHLAWRPGRRLSNDEARLAVISGLKDALAAHRGGRLFDIGEKWDTTAAIDCDDRRLSIALRFWESWADSAAHHWHYYDGLTADDWPRMANQIIDALEQDRDIVDAEILGHFAPQPGVPSALSRWVAKIRTLFKSA